MAEPPTSLADVQALNAGTLSLMRQGQYTEARVSGERALARAEASLGAQHAEVAIALGQLGTIYTFLEKYAEGELSLRRALAIQERTGGKPDEAAVSGSETPGLAAMLNNLAYSCRRQAKYDEADHLYRRASGILESTQGPMSSELAVVLESRAASNEERGTYEVAEALYRRALLIREAKPAPDRAFAQLLNNFALLLWKAGKPDEGERHSLRSIEVFEGLYGCDHSVVADCQVDLAAHYESQGRYREAESRLRRAVAIQETRLPGLRLDSRRHVVVPGESLTLARSLLALARVCERLSKRAEAEQIRARIFYTAEKEPFAGVEAVPGHPGWVEARFGGQEAATDGPGEPFASVESRARPKRWWQFWK